MADPDFGYDDVLLECMDRMEKTVDHLKTEYRGMRTGRANPGLVENVKVDYYGSPTPLKKLANILVPEPTLLVVKPFDPGSLEEIERALMKADIGIHPQSDGKVIRLAIPPLSEERRKQLVSRARESAEEARVAIRNIRREANRRADELENAGTIGEDSYHRLKEEIQDQTKTYEEKVDDLVEGKSDELMEM